MIAFGKEYPLALTVGALEEITAICPAGDINRLGELLDGSTAEVLAFEVAFIAALSRGAEEQRRFRAMAEGGSYVPAPVTPELLRALPPAEFKAAQAEAFRVWRGDKQPTVEAEASKKNADGAPPPAST